MATISAWSYSHEVYNFHLTDIKIEGKKMGKRGLTIVRDYNETKLHYAEDAEDLKNTNIWNETIAR